MTIPELLKEAFLREDWSIIAEAYETLTGKILSNDTAEPTTKSDTQPIVEPEQSKYEDDFSHSWKPKEVRGQQSNAVIFDDYQMPSSPDGDRKPCRTEPIDISKNKINIFEDDGTIAKEDVLIDRKLTNRPVSARGVRQEMIRVRCRQCRNEYTVSKSIVAGSYLCDKCIGGSQWKSRS